ncbi:MAG: hypothetical protein LQ344_006262 [Seirophora lacunosa]|nr:MAG: hypothetical protein LQ344_006262 [Seirophora lacunosa]
MPGAKKKQSKADNYSTDPSSNNGGANRGPPQRFDGASERPSSSAGPGQASGSRSRRPSDAPAAQSTTAASRPASAAGPGDSSQAPLTDPARDPAKKKDQKFILNRRVEWGGNAFNYESGDARQDPCLWSSAFSNHTSFLLDPAEYWWLSVGDYPFAPVLFLNTLVFSNTPHKSTLPYTSFTPLGIMLNPKDPFAAGDPSAETIRIPIEHATLMDGTPVQPERQVIIDTNPFRYQMPKELMRRPGYGSVGEKVRLKLNSHILEGSVEKTVYQYAVLIGSGSEKRGLIKALWHSKQVLEKLPGGMRDWLFDGNALAWSVRQVSEIHITVDLDAEHGRAARDNKPDIFQVVIKPAAKINLSNIYEYLQGRSSFGPHVITAINFLDHLIREWPSNNHVNIKRSYFNRDTGDKYPLSGGIEAMRGVYQSIRLAEGKKMIVNIDVSHTTFWNVTGFASIINHLTGHMDLETLQYQWRDQRGKTNFKFAAMRRLRANFFNVKHKNQKNQAEASKKEWKVASIIPQSAHEFKFIEYDKETKKDGAEISVFDYYKKTYDIHLNYAHLPVVATTKNISTPDPRNPEIRIKSPIVFPMELCLMRPSQRYPYKLNELQTANMIKFAVQQPHARLQGINKGLDMLAWDEDPFLKQYGLRIHREQIQTAARILPPPRLQFGGQGPGAVVAPGTSGRWDLKGKKFLHGNTAPLISWGVMIIQAHTYSGRTLQIPQAQAFITAFVDAYKNHGGTVKNTTPIIQVQPHADLPKAIEMLLMSVGNKHNLRPQMFMFILPDKNADIYLRIKKSCDCRWGVYSQCVQGQQAVKVSPQYISNVLMKFNAKLGGTTNRIVPQGSGHFSSSTMIIGADVSHSAPNNPAPSYAAMTVSQDKYAARYAAGVQTNGRRVEMITTRNLNDMLTPLFREWIMHVNGGSLPDHVYYFRDGVSEAQFVNVLKTEVADMKEIFAKLGETRKGFSVKFTVVVAEKRHHIRFFPQGKGADKGGNPLPGTIVDRDVTHPFDNDFYLCAHRAIQGTARPVHYTVLLDEINVSVDTFQKLLYEQCYQYIRSTTPVSLHPAVYYAHLASNRAKAHENISETERRARDWAEPTGSSSARDPEEPKPLILMNNVDKIQGGMWFV